MEYLYAAINFLLLLGIAWLLLGKSLKTKFEERRTRISSELDAAEATERAADAHDLAALGLDAPKEEEAPSPVAESLNGAEQVRERTELEKARLDAEAVAKSSVLRRESLLTLRTKAVKKLCQKVRAKFSEPAYADAMRRKEPLLAARILELIKLTPGDMCYLMHHDVLYVTLTSAFPLDEELVERIGTATEALLDKVNGRQSLWVREDPTLIGGLRLRIGDTVYDCSVENRLYHLERDLVRRPMPQELTPEAVIADMEQGIAEAEDRVDVYQLGRVLSVSDGICRLDGLADIMYGEVIEFECGERGMILDIEPERIGCVVFGSYENIETMSRVRRIGRIASVPVGDELLGRVVDPLGRPLDGGDRIQGAKRRPIEFGAPGIPDRKSVSVPLSTGLKAVDALVPIGRGQRELIIGDRQTGKSALAIDTIINQKGKGVVCIYVAIGQKESTVAGIRAKLEQSGAMEYTTIVSATASSSASMQYIAPFAGAAMSEYYMYSGRDALIVYDDLSKHAVAYRELSLLLHRPSGREAYPGDVFYLHSRLLERSARLSSEAGGGSVTALPIIETQAGDISAYIPTNVISITDGQIFLETDLFNEGQRPAVNVGLSVSRVGSAAQTKLLKQVSGKLRMELAQYRELNTFSQFGSDIDESTKRVLARGERMMTALRQRRYSPIEDAKQALLIYAVSEGFADAVEPERMEQFESALYEWFEANESGLMERLRTGAAMNKKTEAEVRSALSRFAEVFDADAA